MTQRIRTFLRGRPLSVGIAGIALILFVPLVNCRNRPVDKGFKGVKDAGVSIDNLRTVAEFEALFGPAGDYRNKRTAYFSHGRAYIPGKGEECVTWIDDFALLQIYHRDGQVTCRQMIDNPSYADFTPSDWLSLWSQEASVWLGSFLLP